MTTVAPHVAPTLAGRALQDLGHQLATMRAERDALRSALRWYADPAVYVFDGPFPPVLLDDGARARTALAVAAPAARTAPESAVSA